MRLTRTLTVAMVVVCSLPAMPQSTAALSAEDQRYIDKIHFLCEWAKTNVPEANPVTIRVCAPGATLDSQQAWEDSTDWWQHFRDREPQKAAQLERDFDAANATRVAKLNAAAAAVASAAAKKQQAARAKASKENLLRSIPTMTVPELCRVVRRGNVPQALEELVSRKAFSPAETGLIAGSKVALGMSEDAMLCSLGTPERTNRSVGTWGVHIQYVYEGLIVYTENGKVTSWQD